MQPFGNSELITLHGDSWLHKQRVAGKVVAEILSQLKKLVDEKTNLSMLELSRFAENYIVNNGCSATFKGYHGFPEAVCISINNQLVHGIPTDYKLQDGDIVTFDLGATYDGAIADSAVSYIYGEGKPEHIKLLRSTEEALYKAIKVIKVGDRLGSIGEAIYKSAKNNGFNVITQYGGHGLAINNPHVAPFVCNKGRFDEGVRFQQGLSIAIEPLFVIGDTKTYTDKDGWTVCSAGICAHFEHTVYVHEDHVEIITDGRNVHV